MKICKGKSGPHQYSDELRQCPECKIISEANRIKRPHVVLGIVKTCRKGHQYSDTYKRCPKCRSVSKKNYSTRNKERLKPALNARSKKWQKDNPEKNMLRSAKSSAKARGIEFAIDVSDIIIPDICPILNIPLFRSEGKPGPNTPSLDRIDNSKGYIPGNVWVISLRANKLKLDATLEELELLIAAMRNLKSQGKL